ncbi:MAG: ChpI protein [bacterium]
MKTAIYIPDPLFELAEKVANKLGLSRSKLFSLALEEFIEKHNWEEVTKELDQIYSQQDSKLDPLVSDLQYLSLSEESW